jgi:hAT family C-terminal dimerisation region
VTEAVEHCTKNRIRDYDDHPRKMVAFKGWLYRKKNDDSAGDEFNRCPITGSANLLTEMFDLITWWSLPDARESFPTLHRWALDIFACPATSCECERAFSRVMKRTTPERNL